MTENKDLKKVIRARMRKTGESYTAARAVVLARTPSGKKSPYAAPRDEWPALAGMSDDAVAKKTGRTWAEWVRALDADEAFAWDHRDIAKHIAEAHATPGWWAQTVAVGYERIRGLREVGQRREGSYDASKSRTFPVDVATLYTAIRDMRKRKQWLPEDFARVRTATKPRSIRADWHDGTQVNFWFIDKGASKSSVSVQHGKLAKKADVDRMKALWSERFDALRDMLRG